MRAFWREWQASVLEAGHAAHDEGRRPEPAEVTS
jgi:predicted transcriptional regulator